MDTVYDSFRFDKGRRVLAGVLHLLATTDYFMFVDCDDFVHHGLADFVRKHDGANGWYLKHGYIWNDGGEYLLKFQDYSELCGSSLIIRADLLAVPATFSDADPDYIKLMLGSHIANQEVLRNRNTPLAPLPFAGGVYRVAHSQAHSLSDSLFSQYFFNFKNLIRPHRFLINLINLKKMNSRFRSQFFGA